MAVLIDPDRSEMVDREIRIKNPPNVTSLMYPYVPNWTYRHWDWRQLSLMIVHLISPRSHSEYHTIPPDFRDASLNHDFLKTLYNEGKPFSLMYSL